MVGTCHFFTSERNIWFGESVSVHVCVCRNPPSGKYAASVSPNGQKV